MMARPAFSIAPQDRLRMVTNAFPQRSAQPLIGTYRETVLTAYRDVRATSSFLPTTSAACPPVSSRSSSTVTDASPAARQ